MLSFQTVLAPMRALTTPAFMRILVQLGAPDRFMTEFFRVHKSSALDTELVEETLVAVGGVPCIFQLLGENSPALLATAVALQAYPVAGIDINLGCPMPKIYKKYVGGGLLRTPAVMDTLLAELRSGIRGFFSAKTRLGFRDVSEWPRLRDIFKKHALDGLTIHGRTVAQGYCGAVCYEPMGEAVRLMPFPVWANGDIRSAEQAFRVVQAAGCAGVMIGRGALHNPWIFRQIHERQQGVPCYQPTYEAVREYIELLRPACAGRNPLGRLKGYLNYIGPCVDEKGAFLHAMRRADSEAGLLGLCDEAFRSTAPFPLLPYPDLLARPNREGAR